MLRSGFQRSIAQLVALVSLLWLLIPVLAITTVAGAPQGRPIPEGTPQPDPARIGGLSLDAQALYDGMYRVGSWVPVRVTVQNDGADVVAEVRVSARSGPTFATRLDLPKGARKSVEIYAFVPTFARRMVVSLVPIDSPATTSSDLGQQQITLDPQRSNRRMVAVIDSDGNRMSLPERLPNDARVIATPIELADIPAEDLGLTSFDMLILGDVPTATLTEAQRAALHAWVVRGGQLVISGGAETQRTLEGLPEALQPVRVLGTESIPAAPLLDLPNGDLRTLDLALVEPIDASTRPLYNYAFPNRGASTVDDQPLLMERPVGAGAVIFAAVALDDPVFADWEGTRALWSDLFPAKQGLQDGFGPEEMSIENFVEHNVASALTQLPALKMPSLATLGTLLMTYIVLVGPLTYLVLRRLDRQALGWLIVPTVTVVFALVAYGTGYAKRGGDVVLNQITLIEPLSAGQSNEPQARVRSFVGVFSPALREYDLETPRTALVRPISIQGPWGAENASSDGVFLQHPDASLATGVEATNLSIPQWSMRAVMADELQPYQGATAEITIDGDQLFGTVTNTGEHTLHDVVMVQGNRLARFDQLEPGEHQQAELRTHTAAEPGMMLESMPLSYLIYGDLMEQSSRMRSEPLPPEIQLRSQLLDALYGYGPMPRQARPLLLAWVEHAPMTFTIPDQRVEHQQLSLITFSPSVQVANERVTLESGWFQHQIDGPPDSFCLGSRGMGFNLFMPPVLQTLQLPRELAGLRPAELSLVPAADGNWPKEIDVDVFEWANGEWLTFSLGRQPLDLPDPERFVNETGTISLRFDDVPPSQDVSGCLYVDATLTGTMGGS